MRQCGVVSDVGQPAFRLYRTVFPATAMLSYATGWSNLLLFISSFFGLTLQALLF